MIPILKYFFVSICASLNFLEPHLDEVVKHTELLLMVHRVDQGLEYNSYYIEPIAVVCPIFPLSAFAVKDSRSHERWRRKTEEPSLSRKQVHIFNPEKLPGALLGFQRSNVAAVMRYKVCEKMQI